MNKLNRVLPSPEISKKRTILYATLWNCLLKMDSNPSRKRCTFKKSVTLIRFQNSLHVSLLQVQVHTRVDFLLLASKFECVYTFPICYCYCYQSTPWIQFLYNHQNKILYLYYRSTNRMHLKQQHSSFFIQETVLSIIYSVCMTDIKTHVISTQFDNRMKL